MELRLLVQASAGECMGGDRTRQEIAVVAGSSKQGIDIKRDASFTPWYSGSQNTLFRKATTDKNGRTLLFEGRWCGLRSAWFPCCDKQGHTTRADNKCKTLNVTLLSIYECPVRHKVQS